MMVKASTPDSPSLLSIVWRRERIAKSKHIPRAVERYLFSVPIPSERKAHQEAESSFDFRMGRRREGPARFQDNF
jgi:hypothetical protein